MPQQEAGCHAARRKFICILVWATWQRLPLVTPEIERDVYRCIESEAQTLHCSVLAISGLADHVHLAARVTTSVTASQLAKQVKGVSSTLVRQTLRPDELFRWQEGFGVFSVSRSHLPSVIAYVQNQKRHHAAGNLWTEWEAVSAEE